MANLRADPTQWYYVPVHSRVIFAASKTIKKAVIDLGCKQTHPEVYLSNVPDLDTVAELLAYLYLGAVGPRAAKVAKLAGQLGVDARKLQ